MNKFEVECLKAQHSLEDWVGRFTTLSGRSDQELKGPCPFCGGRDRFSLFKDRRGWMCRGCTPESGDLITFIERAFATDFKGAVEILQRENTRISKATHQHPARIIRSETCSAEWRSDSWQEAARSELDLCLKALKSSSEGLAYLAAREISSASASIWCLGYSEHKRAIVLPWIAADGRITAIKYRYVQSWKDKGGKLRRFTQLAGSRQLVFGAQLLQPDKPTIIVEGEFNAISIRQAICGRANVISAGGDSNFGPMVSLIPRLKECAVWLDSASRVQNVIERLPSMDRTPPFLISTAHGDANELLVKYGPETLAGVVVGLLKSLH